MLREGGGGELACVQGLSCSLFLFLFCGITFCSGSLYQHVMDCLTALLGWDSCSLLYNKKKYLSVFIFPLLIC